MASLQVGVFQSHLLHTTDQKHRSETELEDFHTPLTQMDKSSRPKINKETQALKDTLDQIDLIDIYRTFHPKAAEYIFSSSAHGTFSRIDHISGQKSNLSIFKNIKIISSIFSDHNTMRLEINYMEKKRKKHLKRL